MSVTSGFFNSKNRDRLYNAVQISSIFDGIIRDGIFASIGDAFIVKSTGGMNITVGTGRAWFNSTWTLNDALLPLTISAADVALPRYTSVVLEVDTRDSIRNNSIKLIDGKPASNPVPNNDKLEEGLYRYRLADIYIANNAVSISQSNITNLIGTSECPFVTGILETVNTDDLVQQWQDRFNTLISGSEDNFDRLFAEMQAAIADILDQIVPDGAVSTTIEFDLPSNWSGETAPYTQRLAVIGVKESDNPIADVMLSNDYQTSRIQQAEWSKIYRFKTEDRFVTVFANNPTTSELRVRFRCIRK